MRSLARGRDAAPVAAEPAYTRWSSAAPVWAATAWCSRARPQRCPSTYNAASARTHARTAGKAARRRRVDVDDDDSVNSDDDVVNIVKVDDDDDDVNDDDVGGGGGGGGGGDVERLRVGGDR